MLKRLRGMFSTDMSIDLGTANTLIYVKDKGIILDEALGSGDSRAQRSEIYLKLLEKKPSACSAEPREHSSDTPPERRCHRRFPSHGKDAAALYCEGA